MPEGDQHDERRRRYAQLKADQHQVEQAAARLRQRAIREGYAGRPHQAVAFALALLLDELRLHLRDLDDEMRERVVELCVQLA